MNTTDATHAVTAISVVVPVHDEEETVVATLDAINQAACRVPVPVSVTVVFDRCTDASETRVAAAAGRFTGVEIRTLSGYFRHIGAVRNAGVADAATWGAAAGIPLGQHWTAHTDADSVVPPHWLSCQRDQAESGNDLVIGTVRPDEPADSPTARLWTARHTLAEGHTSVHGANLGVRLDRLLDVEGFVGTAVGEDVATVQLLKDLGVPWVATDRARVLTSARRTSRIVGGFADRLRELDALSVPESEPESQPGKEPSATVVHVDDKPGSTIDTDFLKEPQ